MSTTRGWSKASSTRHAPRTSFERFYRAPEDDPSGHLDDTRPPAWLVEQVEAEMAADTTTSDTEPDW